MAEAACAGAGGDTGVEPVAEVEEETPGYKVAAKVGPKIPVLLTYGAGYKILCFLNYGAGLFGKVFQSSLQVDLKAMVEKDSEDESLRKYKAALLGAAAADPSAAAADAEKRQVIVHEMRIEVEGRPDIVIPLASAEDVERAEKLKVPVKEGVGYVTKIVFSVHREVVLGLKFHNVVYSSVGIPLDRVSQMVGSYPPTGTRNEFRMPAGEWPSGMFARGTYKAKAKFTDDDSNTHLAFNWSFDIRKSWPDEA